MFDGGFSNRYRISQGQGFALHQQTSLAENRLSDEETGRLLKQRVKEIAELQNLLYANRRWSLLVIFQAMDAAGKDSAIRNVFSGVNPQGCEVHNFRAPSLSELEHNFLWRAAGRTPARGKIGIFNRSWYEETLIVRVHPELLVVQQLPEALVSDSLWDERLEDIAAFEKHLARSGTVVLKFYLHLSREEQKKRLLARLDNPEKNWKFDQSDIDERDHWDTYMHAYEQAIGKTARPWAPWFVIPADNKPYARLVVADAVLSALQQLNLSWPRVSEEQKAVLARCRERLQGE